MRIDPEIVSALTPLAELISEKSFFSDGETYVCVSVEVVLEALNEAVDKGMLVIHDEYIEVQTGNQGDPNE